MRLIRQFLGARKPILGICRGAQLINVALGGTLYQDIPSELANPDSHAPATLQRVVHEVAWGADSSLARLYPRQNSGAVVSVHHQAIKELGQGLSIEAVSVMDGMIEAIRLKDGPYVVGLQWHPECHAGDTNLLDCDPILDEFLAEARRVSEAI